jgi:hypothetical protein
MEYISADVRYSLSVLIVHDSLPLLILFYLISGIVFPTGAVSRNNKINRERMDADEWRRLCRKIINSGPDFNG